jgi:hypothetical protein
VWVATAAATSRDHLDKDGNIVCSRNLGELVRACDDAHGDVWASASGNYVMYKLSGSEVVTPVVTSPPQCKISGAWGCRLRLRRRPGQRQQGVGGGRQQRPVADGDRRRHQHRAPVLPAPSGCPNGSGFYGMTVDSDYVWIGAYYCGGVLRCSIDAMHAAGHNGVVREPGCKFIPTGCHPRGTAVAQDGFVYSALDTCQGVVKIDRAAGTVAAIINTGYTSSGAKVIPIGAAIDRDGRLWRSATTRRAPSASTCRPTSTSGSRAAATPTPTRT